MKILNDLYSEIKRLFIAGSKFAPGDMRISRLLPQLQKIGEKSPVIKRLADMTEDMLNSSQPEVALPDLGVFLLAIMNTQGNINIENLTEQENKPFFKELPITTVPYSALEPVITALTTTGQGRYETIKNAFESGNLNDFRLYSHIAKALDDKYAELADLIRTIIKSIGEQMIPFILRDLDIKSKKKSDGARMELLDALNYEHITTLAEQALQEGSSITKVEALKILGRDSTHEELLLTYLEDRKSDVKEAALIGLIRMDSVKGYEKFLQILESKQFDSAIPAVKYCKNNNYIDQITNTIEDKFKVKSKKYDDNLYWLSAAINDMGELYSHSIAVKIYERIFNTPPFNTEYRFSEHYFNQAKHVYTPEQICEVFLPYYSTNHYFNYDCMEIVLNSEKKNIALHYLKKYFAERWAGNYSYYRSAQLLVRHMESKDLAFVAEGIYEDLTKKGRHIYIFIYEVQRDIFNDPELVNKIFKESGCYDLLTELKDFYANPKNYYNYYNKEFSDLLQRY